MVAKPLSKRFPIDSARGHLQYNPFLLINGALNLKTIENQKNLHRRMSCALVAV